MLEDMPEGDRGGLTSLAGAPCLQGACALSGRHDAAAWLVFCSARTRQGAPSARSGLPASLAPTYLRFYPRRRSVGLRGRGCRLAHARGRGAGNALRYLPRPSDVVLMLLSAVACNRLGL